MTMAERNACKPFRWDDVADSDSDWESEDEGFLTQFEKSKKRKEREYLGHSDYINCEFVLGNGAVVESLWSVFESFNDKRRRGSSPITNEMILFLRDNKDLWGIEMFIKPMRIKRQAPRMRGWRRRLPNTMIL